MFVSNSLDRPMTKRCTGLSTCVLGKLSQDIHKLQTFPRTDVGAGTPGKKRSLSDQYENYGNSYNWSLHLSTLNSVHLSERLLVHPALSILSSADACGFDCPADCKEIPSL